MRLLLIVLIGLVIASCAPQKRFTRLVTKHPWLLTTDTVTIHDTVKVIVPKVEHDTAFIDRALYDTVYIEKDKLKIKLWKVVDTVRVEGTCESDTIEVVREVKVPVKYYETGKWWHKIPWWIYLLAIGIVSYYLYRRFKKLGEPR